MPGIGRAGIFGGTEREVRVEIDPRELGALRLTVGEVADALRLENRNISAGDFDEGKRRYIVRTLGEFENVADIEDVVVARRGSQVIRIRDIGHAALGYQDAGLHRAALRQPLHRHELPAFGRRQRAGSDEGPAGHDRGV